MYALLRMDGFSSLASHRGFGKFLTRKFQTLDMQHGVPRKEEEEVQAQAEPGTHSLGASRPCSVPGHASLFCTYVATAVDRGRNASMIALGMHVRECYYFRLLR